MRSLVLIIAAATAALSFAATASAWRVVASDTDHAWAAGDSVKEGSATTVPARPSLAAQGLSATKSCLWYRGKRRWCLPGWEGEEWSIWQYEGREHRGRYYVENHRNEVLGYLRPTSYGWRAMVSVCGLAGPHNCGWARGGKVVRVSRNVLYVYSNGKPRGAQGNIYDYRGPRREVARGPDAIAVAAYKLVIGDL